MLIYFIYGKPSEWCLAIISIPLPQRSPGNILFLQDPYLQGSSLKSTIERHLCAIWEAEEEKPLFSSRNGKQSSVQKQMWNLLQFRLSLANHLLWCDKWLRSSAAVSFDFCILLIFVKPDTVLLDPSSTSLSQSSIGHNFLYKISSCLKYLKLVLFFRPNSWLMNPLTWLRSKILLTRKCSCE